MNSKLKYCFSLAAIFAIFALQPTLEAAGWGTTDEVEEFEGESWNNVYFDMNGIYFDASIPNYSDTAFQNGVVSINGRTDDNFAYSIITNIGITFKPPKSQKEFVKIIQDANPDFIVKTVDSKKLGAKYALDLIPANQNAFTYWRFLFTNYRLIQMGTDDLNENRRHNFFESIYIQ